jgi:hypothetical protein
MIDTRAQAAHFAASEVRMSYSRTAIDLNISIKIEQPKWYQPSDEAISLMGYLAASDRLTPDEKRAVVRLLAMADHYATGREHDKLMRAIAALVGLMAFNARMREAQPQHSFSDVMAFYQEQRRALDPTGGKQTAMEITLNLSVEIEQFSLRYVGVSATEAQQTWHDLTSRGEAAGPSIPLRVDGVGAAPPALTRLEV